MKKRDENNKMKISQGDYQSNVSKPSGVSNFNYDENNIMEFRHGYGIQYWTDGAHYEGQWYFNKAEG